MLLLLLLLVLCCCQSDASFLYRRQSFSWRASLDCCTGIASSFEQSIFSPKEASKTTTLPSTSETIAFVEHEFCSYPRFLEKFSLTLGFCRVLPSSKHHFDLRFSILPVTLLRFGEPQISKTNHAICVQIPVVGGLLAKINPNSTDNGSLSFTWYQEMRSECNPPKITVVTKIAGNYKPSIAGSRRPVPCWRNKFYCTTQRLFHEYVMYRFHDFVLKEFEKLLTHQSSTLMK